MLLPEYKHKNADGSIGHSDNLTKFQFHVTTTGTVDFLV